MRRPPGIRDPRDEDLLDAILELEHTLRYLGETITSRVFGAGTVLLLFFFGWKPALAMVAYCVLEWGTRPLNIYRRRPRH